MPDGAVYWEINLKDYNPVEYTAQSVLSKPFWADDNDPSTKNYNCLDGTTDRRTHLKKQYTVIDGRPLNPIGRTGIKGKLYFTD